METTPNPPEVAAPQGRPRKIARRRITWEDAEVIAIHVARGMTETHACLQVPDLQPVQWFNWKNANSRSQKCSELFERMRASRLNNLITNVEIPADVDRARAANVRHDWRAAQYLAGIVDPKFSNQPALQQVVNQSNISIAVGGDGALKRLVESYAESVRNKISLSAEPRTIEANVEQTSSSPSTQDASQ